MHKRGVEYQDFLSKVFCVTVPETSVGETFFVALISGVEKVWIRGGGGGYQDFPSKINCLTVPKALAGEPFRVSQNLLTGKSL